MATKVYEPATGTSIETTDIGGGVMRQGTSAHVVWDERGLTERMFAKAPQTGYSVWFDTADATYIYIAEAPSTETAGTGTTFQGIRVQKDASGNPLGKVQTATGFAWNSRSSAGWS